MSETTQQFKKQLPKNAIMAGMSFVTYSLIAIWLTPYLLEHLGKAAYGLVPLAGLLTQYVAIITKQISGAVNRFLTIELNKPDGEPNVIFNSAFALYLLLILLQIPLFGAAIHYADHIFSIPEELMTDALILIGCSALTFLFTLLSGVFAVSVFSANRLDIGAGFNICRLIARLLLIVMCFNWFGAKLRYIGMVDLSLTLAQFPFSIYYWRKFTPQLYISFRRIRWRILGPIFNMSIWSLINQLGGVLLLRMDIWIINRFISPAMAGVYAAIIVVANSIRQLGMFLNGQLGPIVMKYWARDEFYELQRMALMAVKLLSIILVIPSALICFHSKEILHVWLEFDDPSYSWILIVLCMHIPFTVALYPLYQIQTASNSIKIPSIVTVTVGVLNVLFSYFLGVTMQMGALGVAIATAVVLFLRNTFFTAVYGAHLLKLPFYAYFGPLFSGTIMFFLIWLISLVPFSKYAGLDVGQVQGLLLSCIVTASLAGALGWRICFTMKDRRQLTSFLPVKIRNPIVSMDAFIDRCLGFGR